MPCKKSVITKVGGDFRRVLERKSQKTGKSMVEISNDIARMVNLMDGKKRFKKRIIEEVDF